MIFLDDAVCDYRAGKHDRHMFHDDQDEPDPHAELTYWAAEELGMINPPPPSQSIYDYLLILGGLATGVEPRVRYAAQLVDEGLEIRHQIAALGSFRPLQDRELPISTRYAPDGRYEIDHLVSMLGVLFGATGNWATTTHGDPATDPARASLATSQTRPDGPALAAYAAASSDPGSRSANTADTYLHLAQRPTISYAASASSLLRPASTSRTSTWMLYARCAPMRLTSRPLVFAVTSRGPPILPSPTVKSCAAHCDPSGRRSTPRPRPA